MIKKVEICGVNTSKLPVLSNEEKEKLFLKIKAGDMKAREEFINGNLKLVLSVVRKFNNRGENVDDLFQIGCIALIDLSLLLSNPEFRLIVSSNVLL